MAENAVEAYVHEIVQKYQSGYAKEHAYRSLVEGLVSEIDSSLTDVVNDPKRSEHGAPDFVFLRDGMAAGYAEAKDVDADLDQVAKSEQLERYYGYANLILMNYIEFRFYRNGAQYCEPIEVARLTGNSVTPVEENYRLLENTLHDFLTSAQEPIRSGEHLAKIMGAKARRICDSVHYFLTSGKDNEKNEELERIYQTVRELLVHDLTEESFADMYAQTLVYGLFVARYHDETEDDFSRQEARDLVPKSNPFLRHFFDHIVGPDFDKRLEYIVNELCDTFSRSDVGELMTQYYKKDLWGGEHAGPDPVIHFYEDFLNEYDPVVRRKMGAYYTPFPVVSFIVSATDSILRSEFNLDGLADNSKLENGTHRVQVLDPAAGTGTFISAIIRRIYEDIKEKGQEGRWTSYVHHDLLPRVHGFELMMAPYTIAHLKLSVAFEKTGFKYFNKRLGIYLTNTLEEGQPQKDLFSGFGLTQSIAEESKEASKIKNKTPIMVVMGNPPYAGESSNAHYAGHDVYKQEPTGGKLQERNSKWINDDYVKFIRFAENMIKKTGEGVVSMITAHGYIDNPTFRGMRYHLMQTFDTIYVLDLHGNANKKEQTPEGGKDENVFNIRTGVAILIGVKKKGGAKGLADVYRFDCWGSRQEKFTCLNDAIFGELEWEKLEPAEPNYTWTKRDNELWEEYRKGFSVDELFRESSVGIVTSRDHFVIAHTKEELRDRMRKFFSYENPEQAKQDFNLRENKKWKVAGALKGRFNEEAIVPIAYRPFDIRWIYYDEAFIERSRTKTTRHFIGKDNLGFNVCRQVKSGETYQHILSSREISESTLISNKTSEIGYVFPLHVYEEGGVQSPNLNRDIVKQIEGKIGVCAIEDIFDYTYAVLHSPSYREKYKEFLKIDFPRVPYPNDKKVFSKLVEFGSELRSLHLLEPPKLNEFITTYPESGSDTVEKGWPKFIGHSAGSTKKPGAKVNLETSGLGDVFINNEQYFGGVPEVAWNFYIGGYQPAQKWLKDRRGRQLTNEDIEHYQKIIVALAETDRIMKAIDEIME